LFWAYVGFFAGAFDMISTHDLFHSFWYEK